MIKIIIIACVTLLATVCQANPVCDVSRAQAKGDLEESLLESYGSSYSTVLFFLNAGMEDYDTLCQLPKNSVTNDILQNLKDSYYPSFSTILFFYKIDKAAYDELGINTGSTSSGSTSTGSTSTGSTSTGSTSTGSTSTGSNTDPIESKPFVATNAASTIRHEIATLEATVSPNGWYTVLYFDYRTFDDFENDYGDTLNYKSIGAGIDMIAVAERINGLSCGTTYYYRARATNIFGTSYGDTKSFTTYRCNDSELVGNLESPKNGSHKSGIGVLRGWVCNAGNITVSFDGGSERAVVYGNYRGDTESICGDADNGFELLYNWNMLGEGEHIAVVYVEGIELASTSFEVQTLSANTFIRGLTGSYELVDFPYPGQSTTVTWSEEDQNFVITDVK